MLVDSITKTQCNFVGPKLLMISQLDWTREDVCAWILLKVLKDRFKEFQGVSICLRGFRRFQRVTAELKGNSRELQNVYLGVSWQFSGWKEVTLRVILRVPIWNILVFGHSKTWWSWTWWNSTEFYRILWNSIVFRGTRCWLKFKVFFSFSL